MLCSIVIPIFKQYKYLNETIQSLKEQTFQDFECIIIDDGSEDENLNKKVFQIIEDDKRFQFYHQPHNGVSSARNFGLNKSIGKYIVFLDADDYISRNFLKDNIDILENNQTVSIVIPTTILFNCKETIVNESWKDYKYLLYTNTLYITNLIRRDNALKCGGFDENLQYTEDWEFYIRLLYHNNNVVINDQTIFYYRANSSVSGRMNYQTLLKCRQYIFKKNKKIFEEYNFIKNASN